MSHATFLHPSHVPSLRSRLLAPAIALAFACLAPTVAAAQAITRDTTWRAAPEGFPASAAMQAFVGTPSGNEFYAVRIRLRDGDQMGPMRFARDVKVVLVEGSFALGRGAEPKRRGTRRLDPSQRATAIKAGTPIYGWATSGAVIQFEGEGPFEVMPAQRTP